MNTQNLVIKCLRVYSMRALNRGILVPKPVPRTAFDTVREERVNYATKLDATRPIQRRISPLQSMREFFMHPLTWDRNNGYLNILLALAIFGFCFCTSCTSERAKHTAVDEKKKT